MVFNNQIYLWKKFVVYRSVPSQLNHKIKSSWVKHSWFYSNHEDIISRYKVYTTLSKIILEGGENNSTVNIMVTSIPGNYLVSFQIALMKLYLEESLKGA